jgi:alkylation response protein AidB-like acyl-CoA dehydrogenase
MHMALTTEQLAEQKKQAEELLAGPEQIGFAKGLFFGQFHAALLFPYPEISPEEKPALEQTLAETRRLCAQVIDPVAIDRNAAIPQEAIAVLGQAGILGLTAPTEYGGKGFSQLAACKVMEVIGAHCSSTSVFVNAHHSIGIRALLLFGTDEQKRRWLPDLAAGKKLGAFALTEPEAGSDAANVQTTATPTADGDTFILNGTKQYITNGGIAGMLTVMARTPAGATPGADPREASKITAFLVTPDMPGFQVLEARMPKCGIRGTATARLAFKDMPVPAANILGPIGKGLKVALTVLDFGRTTFGATCSGAAKTCLRAACQYAKQRIQFKQPLAEFELVKKKLAFMAANAFAMEATTDHCAAGIDRALSDYMLETAMLKVWSTDALWQMVNDTIQIHGGKAYFNDQPYERMMRDARINTIGEGANDVLKAFIALVGMRAVGQKLKGVMEAMQSPWQQLGKLWSFGKSQIEARFSTPDVPVHAAATLGTDAHELGKRVRDFGLAVQQTLMHFRKTALKNKPASGPAEEELLIAREMMQRQYMDERLADAACDLYASACALSRLDHLVASGKYPPAEVAADVAAGRYFLRLANRRIQQNLAALWDNDDEQTTAAANAALGRF